MYQPDGARNLFRFRERAEAGGWNKFRIEQVVRVTEENIALNLKSDICGIEFVRPFGTCEMDASAPGRLVCV